jgi:predicted permease
MSRWVWLDDLVRDVRFAARTLLKTPGFTLIAVLSLALATGATTAIFSIVNSVLLRPLPFADPGRLVQIYGRMWAQDAGAPDPVLGPVASRELEAYGKESTTLEGFVGYNLTTRHLDGPNGVERLTAVETDLGAFSLLGVDPVAGRTFRADDPLDVAVLSAGLWQRRFGGDPSIVGKTVTLNGRSFTVLGVMPETFQFPAGVLAESRTDVWTPIRPLRSPEAQPPLRQGRVPVVARLKPGATLEAATAELRLIAQRVEDQNRESRVRIGVRIVPLSDAVLGRVRRSLWMLFAAVLLVLTAACANLASLLSLLLARMTLRTREVVTRAALGATSRRLVRQFLAESLLLSLAGGVFGAALARWGTDFLVAIGSAKIPRAYEISLDWRAFVFLGTVCLATAVLFGLAPALAAARVSVNEVAREGSGHTRAVASGTFGVIRNGLIVVEVALAFVLALGAAVVVREVIRLQNVDTGMVTSNVLTLHVTPRAADQDYYAIAARAAQLPGVIAVGFTQMVPLQNSGWEAGFEMRGRPVNPSQRLVAGLRYVTPDYFRALGIPIIQGRGFTNADTAGAPRVIMVNDALVNRYFPGEELVGRELDRGTIVGVVRSVRQVALDRPAEPELYYPVAQNVTMYSDAGMSLIVRTSNSVESHTEAIRAAVRSVNPKLAVFNVKTMEQVLTDSLWELNLYVRLIGLFAALAIVLTAIGLYGVISYDATSRMREFALRLVLGSEPRELSRLVLGRAVRLAGAGLVTGILIALALATLVRSLPINVGTDPRIYGVISALIVAVTLLACLVPALRAARVDPAAALRHD